jgi:hypothetical protein
MKPEGEAHNAMLAVISSAPARVESVPRHRIDRWDDVTGSNL